MRWGSGWSWAAGSLLLLIACNGKSTDSADASAGGGIPNIGSGGSAGTGAMSVGGGGTIAAGGSGLTPGTGGAIPGSGGTAGATSCDPSQCVPIKCPAGEVGALLAGACCRQVCVRLGDAPDASVIDGSGGRPPVLIDAGTCATSPMPGCPSNNWPYCVPDWQTAMDWYMTCPNPFSDAYLATCGGVNAIVVRGPYQTRSFLYDHFGRLAGFESIGEGKARCEAYLPGFVAPLEECEAIGAPCFDAGTPHVPDLSGLDAGAIATWGDGVPDCKTGQAAYDAYLASQLAQYNGCTSDNFCVDSPASFDRPSNRCVTPCDLILTANAINSQIMQRLDQFGNLACARCDTGPPPACEPTGFLHGTCVNHRCVFTPN